MPEKDKQVEMLNVIDEINFEISTLNVITMGIVMKICEEKELTDALYGCCMRITERHKKLQELLLE